MRAHKSGSVVVDALLLPSIVPAVVMLPVVVLAYDTDPADELVTVYVPLYPAGTIPDTIIVCPAENA